MPRPSTLGIRIESFDWGSIVSKFSRRRASRAAAGVFPATGVRFHDVPTCAGLGLMFRKSAKLIFAEGVLRPKPGKGASPPRGVDIIDEGRGVDFIGGVEGASMRDLEEPCRAGDGEVARYMRRFASSSPAPSRAAAAAVNPDWRRRAERATAGGGVRGARGGEEWICERLNWNEVMGRSSSSSSERRGDLGSSGTVEVSETKERLGAWVVPKRAWRRG